MKCLVAIDSVRTEIIFLSCDAQFNDFLKVQAKNLYGEDYEPPPSAEPDLDIATSYFLPLITIQNKQHQQSNPINSVHCKDGMVLAFHRFDNIDVIALEDEKRNTGIALLHCVMFEKLAKLHLGPATLFLKPDDLVLRYRLWTKIGDYMEAWDDVTGLSEKYFCSDVEYFSLIFEENFKQHFLFQAVEELQINSVLKKQSGDLMMDALKSAQKIDRTYCQAILVVNGKVLCSHSTRQAQRLDPSDLIFILFIAHTSLPKSPADIDCGELPETGDMQYHQQTIFIKKVDQNDHYLPCTLTAVSIRAGIVLILLAEVRTSIAPNICRAIQSLSQLHKQIEEIASTAENEAAPGRIDTTTLSTNFLKVKGVVDFYLTRMQKDLNAIERLSHSWNKIMDDWQAVAEVASHLGEENRSFHQFDRIIGDIITALRRLFYAIYCMDDYAEIHQDITDIYRNVSLGLRDSSSFLLVKAQRNFTLSTYLSDFPGIVHFLIINRTKNKIIVPCLSGEGASARYCHKIIQTLYRFHKNMVYSGYLGGFMRKNDLLYGYKLWFQNQDKVYISTENKEQYVPTQPRSQMVCMLYHDMVQHYFGALAPLVDCYELLTIHIGDIPLEYVNDSTARLIHAVCNDFTS